MVGGDGRGSVDSSLIDMCLGICVFCVLLCILCIYVFDDEEEEVRNGWRRWPG